MVYLRNRKKVFCHSIELGSNEEVWPDLKNAVGHYELAVGTSVYHSLFNELSNLQECFLYIMQLKHGKVVFT